MVEREGNTQLQQQRAPGRGYLWLAALAGACGCLVCSVALALAALVVILNPDVAYSIRAELPFLEPLPAATGTPGVVRVRPAVRVTYYIRPGPGPTVSPTRRPATPVPGATPVDFIWADDSESLLGPLAIPPGYYRLTVFTKSSFAAWLTPVNGECGDRPDKTRRSLVFNLSRGGALNGAEALVASNGCTALISIENVRAPWLMGLESVNQPSRLQAEIEQRRGTDNDEESG